MKTKYRVIERTYADKSKSYVLQARGIDTLWFWHDIDEQDLPNELLKTAQMLNVRPKEKTVYP